MEKVSSLAKDNKTKSLEGMVLKIGYDPSNVKEEEELLKKKNVDIRSLRKQLKIPSIEDPRAKEMAETEGHKEEMLKLINEKNVHIKEMEDKMERLVKEKDQNVPMEVIPLNSIPLMGISIATTTIATTTKFPAAILVIATDASEKLAKSMEDMTLQGKEIRRLQEEINNL